MSRLFALLLLLVAPLPVQAGPVVVELYTSQGCSSCPPADALAAELEGQGDVLPLSLNVDYWDYLGWRDDLARPENTARQRAYAKAMSSRRIYTPQMVVQGKGDAVGSRRADVLDTIRQARGWAQPADVSFIGDTVRIAPAGAVAKPCVVWAVRFTPRVERAIGRGENAGRRLTYHNVVRDWRKLADWNGRGPLILPLPHAGDDEIAVIVQDGEVGPILGAARRGG